MPSQTIAAIAVAALAKSRIFLRSRSSSLSLGSMTPLASLLSSEPDAAALAIGFDAGALSPPALGIAVEAVSVVAVAFANACASAIEETDLIGKRTPSVKHEVCLGKRA